MIRPTRALLAVAMLALAACDDAAAPAGRAGAVIVNAYIDTDASGTLTEGDQPIADFELQLERDGQVVATATTNAEGRATFEDVAPGSYRVVTSEAPPLGAVLTTSPSPSAVVSFQGSEPTVDFRFVHLPGTLSGWVYRNDGGTTAYESGTDTPGAGVTVYLRENNGGTAGDTIASTVADADGGYVFTGLAPGSYFVEFEQLGAMNYGTAGRIFPVTVVGGMEAEQSALFTGSIFMTIAEARAAANNTTVAVIGTITVPANTFTSGTGGANSELWIQDATGGIAVFSVPSNSTEYTLGRVIEVVGTKTTFSGKEQITSPTIRVRSNGTAPAPLVVTGTQANQRPDEGELVKIENVEVTAVATGTSTAYDVTTLAPDGQTVRIRVATGTGITRASFTVGNRYDITGVLSEFNGTSQIQPRGTGDIVEKGVAPPPVARVIINEFMANPNAVLDANGEYIELHNWGTAPQDLQGWTIRDNFGVDTIDVSLIVPAGGYVLLGVNGDPAVNGGLTVDVVYKPEIALGNSGDRIVLKDPTDATVDSVNYATNASAQAGVAVGVIDPSADNTNATVGVAGVNWASQTPVISGTNPDRGTPRAQNNPYTAPTAPSTNRVPLPPGSGTLPADPAPARTTSGSGATRR